ncbi:MAG: penicillin-binding transpeptidase domain-containing protein [Planctomycetota bacterium]|nr:penicillin-binding transpeptidase domain-containing protein [Planctomycetota bacterium]MCX8039230.1 penicillin-binding transpeptidase domain-containing protein [Planctomycetota bacterium]MDW8372661.1 penicillin-binding transpeptidase domain-containing protein [Planctomycetota bacterium]
MPERILALAIAIGAVGLLFLARLFQLQVLEGASHAQAAERSLLAVEPLPAVRGRILDRSGAVMAETKPLYHAAVVLADLELTGAARRATALWSLDRRRFDALCGDLTARTRWNGSPALTELVADAFLASPGTALRSGPASVRQRLGLLALDRAALAPGRGDEEAMRRLVEGDALYDHPFAALAREIALRWGESAEVIAEESWAEFGAALDRELGAGGEPALEVLTPFTEAVSFTVPSDGGSVALRARVLLAERREQGELTLARLSGLPLEAVRAACQRQLSGLVPPPLGHRYYYGASADGERIAPLLPLAARLVDIPLPELAAARERVFILQGDPPQSEGLLARLCRRLADVLGIRDPQLLQALIEQHAERLTPLDSARRYRRHHLVLDRERVDRLVDGLAAQAAAQGLRLAVLDIERQLAVLRRRAEREQAGSTRRDPQPLLTDIPHALAVRLAARTAGVPESWRRIYDATDPPLPGLQVISGVGRHYPLPRSAPHVIGLLARAADGGARGASGLERRYDEILRGQAGTRVRIRTPEGPMLLRESAPLPGADLVTEIDLELQALAEDSLERYIELAAELDPTADLARMRRGREWGRGRAGFCLIDARTGGILVLASTPTFDLASANERWQELLADPAQPLIDHAAVAEQPPGSSFKILTALCALENGVMTPGEQVWCQGYMAMVGGRPVLRDHAPAGTYDLAEAIQVSSNVYFAIMADRLAKRHGHGLLPAYARRFGIGWANALDVDSQRVGPFALPTPENIRAIRPREPSWYPSDTWRMGIGQNCQAAPLNVVTIAAAVANGGHIVRPYLVRPASGPVVSDLKIRAAFLEDVRRGMERVTASLPGATARRLQLEGAARGIKVAAKTGTAEWGTPESRASGRTEDHAWLIGYAPAERPTVAFAVFIWNGTFGGKACVPVAKRVLERYFAKYGREGHPPPISSAPRPALAP